MYSIGIDVSKGKLDCCWLRDPSGSKVKTKVFKNSRNDYSRLSDWIVNQTKAETKDVRIVIEATSIYHEPLAYALQRYGFVVCVINPARTKDFSKSLGNIHKTDAKDSHMLALYGERMSPSAWEPEPEEVRELKALIARLDALSADLKRELNRQEKVEFSGSSDQVFKSLEMMIEQLSAEKKRLEKEIDDHIDRHPQLKKNRELLESIPSIGPVLSRTLLSVIHARKFESASQLASYLGLIPRKQESGVWKGRSRLSKNGPGIVRSKIYMAAVVAKTWNPDIKAQYERLRSNGKTAMQAIGAAMRKLVQICFGVIKHQSKYCSQLHI